MKSNRIERHRGKMPNKYGVVIFIMVLLLVSCTETGLVFSSYNHIPDRGWDKRNILRFTPEITDTLATYDISVLLRYNNDYAYNNLWLFVTYPQDTIMRTDTLDCRLADRFGKWYGSGWGASYQQEVPLQSGVRFPGSGKQTIMIQQGMRDDITSHITDVGIKIVRREK
ncbi:gliding motility lipoprotein GldH [Coprobacter tertius]|uniref:Gliding motility lipoprotein GldH n=1 Tax=Coprobacter tertius TaxID=2944915 RepID=A0ABT1MJ93_9BACT|nr:gliding motility lipoprotein GldH [Coprobacter tertius]MCP9612695.1 gliding motility lipoprotein GldH [Coprobacter tertius]